MRQARAVVGTSQRRVERLPAQLERDRAMLEESDPLLDV
jgi:hypothetical protein